MVLDPSVGAYKKEELALFFLALTALLHHSQSSHTIQIILQKVKNLGIQSIRGHNGLLLLLQADLWITQYMVHSHAVMRLHKDTRVDIVILRQCTACKNTGAI